MNPNAELYARHKINFVMGTTGDSVAVFTTILFLQFIGGDRDALMNTTTSSGVHAVIAVRGSSTRSLRTFSLPSDSGAS